MEPRTLHHLKSFPLVIPVGTWSSAHPAVLGCPLARDPFPWWKCSHGHQSLLLLPSLPSSRRGQLCPLSCPPETPSPAHPMPAHTRSREASRPEQRARPAENSLLVRVFHETFETPYLLLPFWHGTSCRWSSLQEQLQGFLRPGRTRGCCPAGYRSLWGYSSLWFSRNIWGE